jgi:hypothetical protein
MSTYWRLLLWAGRGLFVLAPVAVIGCRLTRPVWEDFPLQAGVPGHWIPNTALALSFGWALFLPFLVLPVAPLPLVSTDRGKVLAETVLGTRSVDLRQFRLIRSWYFLGRGTHSVAHLIRDSDKRWFIAWDSKGARVGPRALQPTIDRARGKRVSAGEWVRGLTVVLVWSLCALTIFGLAFSIAVGIG